MNDCLPARSCDERLDSPRLAQAVATPWESGIRVRREPDGAAEHPSAPEHVVGIDLDRRLEELTRRLEHDPLAAMMVRICARDETALRELHRACAVRLLASALRIAIRNEIAEEAVATTFHQVWNRAGEFDAQRATVSTWLHTIVRSRVLDLLRAARSRSRNECDLHEHEFEAIADNSPQPCAFLAATQSKRRLARAMALLTPIQRQVLTLTFLDGLSQQEAAQAVGLPLGTVKSHSRRGLIALRQNARLRAAAA